MYLRDGRYTSESDLQRNFFVVVIQYVELFLAYKLHTVRYVITSSKEIISYINWNSNTVMRDMIICNCLTNDT